MKHTRFYAHYVQQEGAAKVVRCSPCAQLAAQTATLGSTQRHTLWIRTEKQCKAVCADCGVRLREVPKE